MQLGYAISAAGHAGLILWAVLGGAFRPEPMPFEVADVSVVSEEEYAALVAPERGPETGEEIDAPAPPEPEQSANPPPPPEPEPPAERPAPPESSAPAEAPDPAPAPPEPGPPAQAEMPDEAPELDAPVEPAAPELPDRSARPQPRPAPRVAPEAAPPPPPEAEIAPEREQIAEPAPDAPPEPEPEPEETAPEEAAEEIVTEADEPSGAPSPSVRPRSRPTDLAAARPEPEDRAEDEEEADTPEAPSQPARDNRQAVTDALAEALGDAGSETEPAGGPELNDSEIAGLIGAISREWSVDIGSRSADVTVVLEIELTEEGRLASTPRLVSADSEDSAAVEAAMRRARSALIAVSRDGGFALPAEKYEDWRRIEITFNPENMRLR